MRLSEGIRLGSAMKPQCFYVFHDEDGSCAMGAAHDAVGLMDDCAITDYPPEWQRILFEQEVRRCPAGPCPIEVAFDAVLPYEGNVFETIVHLNDEHSWTREQIACWIEFYETPVPVESHEHAAQR